VGRRISLGPEGITLHRNTYPVTGARAEVTEFASGLLGRKHTFSPVIALGSGEVRPEPPPDRRKPYASSSPLPRWQPAAGSK
jgi:hypothetical protein